MKVWLMIAVLLPSFFSTAQQVNAVAVPDWLILTETDARKISPFSRLGEFASLGEIPEAEAAVCAERRMREAGLEYFYAGLAFPIGGAGLGISINHHGIDAYKQSVIGLAFGKKISSIFSLGARFNYHKISIAGYGSAGTLTAAICMRILAGENTVFTCIADNPVGGRLGKSGEKITSRFLVAVGHTVSQKVSLSFRIVREQALLPVFNLFINYAISSKVTVDGGFALNRANGFLGTSIGLKNLRLRQVVAWTQAFGIGPAIILEYKKSQSDD